jgi:hypothetical protein
MPGMCDVRHPRTRHFPFNLSAYHIIACSRQTSPLQLFNFSTLQLIASSPYRFIASSLPSAFPASRGQKGQRGRKVEEWASVSLLL